MSTYFMPFGRTIGFVHKHPDRTARNPGKSWDSPVAFKVFRTREAMARAIRKEQETLCVGMPGWSAVVPLTAYEGYN